MFNKLIRRFKAALSPVEGVDLGDTPDQAQIDRKERTAPAISRSDGSQRQDNPYPSLGTTNMASRTRKGNFTGTNPGAPLASRQPAPKGKPNFTGSVTPDYPGPAPAGPPSGRRTTRTPPPTPPPPAQRHHPSTRPSPRRPRPCHPPPPLPPPSPHHSF